MNIVIHARYQDIDAIYNKVNELWDDVTKPEEWDYQGEWFIDIGPLLYKNHDMEVETLFNIPDLPPFWIATTEQTEGAQESVGAYLGGEWAYCPCEKSSYRPIVPLVRGFELDEAVWKCTLKYLKVRAALEVYNKMRR